MSGTVEDHDLLDRWLAGDEGAVVTLVERHERRAYRTALALVGEDSGANDVMQDAFVQAFRTVHRLREEVAFSTWLYRAIVWEARRYARRNQWRKVLHPLGRATAASRDETEPVAMRLDLVRAVASLPRRQREVVALRFYLDLTEAEVARTLGCPVGTVKSRAARALATLANSPHMKGITSPSGGSAHV